MSHIEALNIHKNVRKVMEGLSENGFQQCFQKWHRCCNACAKSEGGYFEVSSILQNL
jgi:hypothetical protein